MIRSTIHVGRRSVVLGMAAGLLPTRGRAAEPPTQFRWAMISAGANMPAIDIDETYCTILASLHLGTPEAAIAAQLKLTPAELRARLDALMGEGLAHADGRGAYHPSAMVITFADAARYLTPSSLLVEETVAAIMAVLPDVHRRYGELPGFAHVPFPRASLLVLSNALLDNWQIDRVEADYLKVSCPQRKGGRYYFAVFEYRAGDPVEPLGIYGNHNESLGEFSINLYGNQRYNGPPNLVTLTDADFMRRFGFPPGTKAKAARRVLALDLVQSGREPAAWIEPSRLRGLRELGLADASGRPTLPILSAADERGLSDMAAAFAPALLAILERHRRSLEAGYRTLPYGHEGVSFAEFFIWWYHVFYTAVTDRLVADGLIGMPPGNTITYLSVA